MPHPCKVQPGHHDARLQHESSTETLCGLDGGREIDVLAGYTSVCRSVSPGQRRRRTWESATHGSRATRMATVRIGWPTVVSAAMEVSGFAIA